MEGDWAGQNEPAAAGAVHWVGEGVMYRRVVNGKATSLRILAERVEVNAALLAEDCEHLRVLGMEPAVAGPEHDLA